MEKNELTADELRELIAQYDRNIERWEERISEYRHAQAHDREIRDGLQAQLAAAAAQGTTND